QIAKAALMIVRIQPDDIKDKQELEWSHDGIVAPPATTPPVTEPTPISQSPQPEPTVAPVPEL
ncbi:hypothetical protein ACFWNQ_41410, partial [Streptomyces virginiae]|uniref:hypothetical protein n=1 Tax=Streptomyces virginiae TaxID=1961 RepID=UPI00364D5F5F